MKNKGTISLCQQCGSSMKVTSARLALGKGKYCSRACSNASRKPCFHLSLCVPSRSLCAPGRSLCVPGCSTLKGQGQKEVLVRQKGKKTCVCLTCQKQFVVGIRVQEAYCSALCEAYNALASGTITLMPCPWQTGALEPVEYDADYWMSPDPCLGF